MQLPLLIRRADCLTNISDIKGETKEAKQIQEMHNDNKKHTSHLHTWVIKDTFMLQCNITYLSRMY